MQCAIYFGQKKDKKEKGKQRQITSVHVSDSGARDTGQLTYPQGRNTDTCRHRPHTRLRFGTASIRNRFDLPHRMGPQSLYQRRRRRRRRIITAVPLVSLIPQPIRICMTLFPHSKAALQSSYWFRELAGHTQPQPSGSFNHV